MELLSMAYFYKSWFSPFFNFLFKLLLANGFYKFLTINIDIIIIIINIYYNLLILLYFIFCLTTNLKELNFNNNFIFIINHFNLIFLNLLIIFYIIDTHFYIIFMINLKNKC
jgi:hypothetical protein